MNVNTLIIVLVVIILVVVISRVAVSDTSDEIIEEAPKVMSPVETEPEEKFQAAGATYAKYIKVVPPSNNLVRDPIPTIVHQVWLGPRQPPAPTEKWRALCEKYGYTYRLWRDEDFTNLKNQSEYQHMLSLKSYPGASDVARYEVLAEHGGLYADADITPVDLPIFDYLPTTGFGVSLEHDPIKYDLGNGAIFVANGFMVSCPNHPILQRVIQSLPLNFAAFKAFKYMEAYMVTGPYLLNSCLEGLWTVIDNNWIMTDSTNTSFHLTEFNEGT